MPYELKNKEGYTIGDKFASVEDAKRFVPRVRAWRQDESRPMGWNGWLSDPAGSPPGGLAPGGLAPAGHAAAGSAPAAPAEPDYKITFVRVRLT